MDPMARPRTRLFPAQPGTVCERALLPAGLVFAATAWYWIDPAVRYQRAWAALRPGGHLALWSAGHVFPDDGDPIFDVLQEV